MIHDKQLKDHQKWYWKWTLHMH